MMVSLHVFLVLFAVMFFEAGLRTCLLAGDAFLFLVGALANMYGWEVLPLVLLLFAAAFLAENAAYAIGYFLGERLIGDRWGILRPADLVSRGAFSDA